jgi:hypothetical protein
MIFGQLLFTRRKLSNLILVDTLRFLPERVNKYFMRMNSDARKDQD